jgi:hypothetical protein
MERAQSEVTQPVQNLDESADPTNLPPVAVIKLTIAGEQSVTIDAEAGDNLDKPVEDDE